MDMSSGRKRIRSSDVLKALDSGDFDDISVPELDDSCSEGEEPITADIVMNDDTNMNICDVMCQPSHHLDPCFRQSLLLDDVELNSSNENDSDSDRENDNTIAATLDEVSGGEATGENSAAAATSSEKPGQKRHPFADISSSARRPIRQPALVWKSVCQDNQPFHLDAVPGPNRTVRTCQTALDFFMLFFTIVTWKLSF